MTYLQTFVNDPSSSFTLGHLLLYNVLFNPPKSFFGVLKATINLDFYCTLSSSYTQGKVPVPEPYPNEGDLSSNGTCDFRFTFFFFLGNRSYDSPG